MSLEDRQQVHEKWRFITSVDYLGDFSDAGSQETVNMHLESHFRGVSELGYSFSCHTHNKFAESFKG